MRGTDQSGSGGLRRRILERDLTVKRTTLIASALCAALAASSSFAEDKMEKTDKMGRMGKHDKKQDKMDKMDKMEKPGAMQ